MTLLCSHKLVLPDDAKLPDAQTLRIGKNMGYRFIIRKTVGVNMHFRLIRFSCSRLEQGHKITFTGDGITVPGDRIVKVDNDIYDLAFLLCRRRRISCGRFIETDCV